jgi:hypothetical protein
MRVFCHCDMPSFYCSFRQALYNNPNTNFHFTPSNVFLHQGT